MISKVKLGLANRKNKPQSQKKEKKGPLKSVGLVFDLTGVEKKEYFLRYKEELGVKDLNFQSLVCLQNPKEKDQHEGLVFTLSDISLTGKIKNAEVRDFVGREFDLLISFVEKESKASEFIVKKSHAGLKAGRQQTSKELYDLTISSEIEEVAVFIREVDKYLKILRK